MQLSDLGAWAPLFYPLTFVLVALSGAIPAIPSELLVIGSGTMAARGEVRLSISIAVAALGTWVGDIGLYLLFRHRLTGWLDRFRWGRAVHRGILKVLNKAGQSPTYAALVALRFVSGGRTASMAAAGIAAVPFKPLVLLSGIGAVLWAVFLVGMGYLTGAETNLPLWASSLLGMAVGTLVGLILAVYLTYKRRRERKHDSATNAGAGENAGT